MDFTPCVWIQKATCNTKYEYVAINGDDLLIAHDSPEEIIHTLKSKFNLKIQGDGPVEYHLGCDYYQDPNGTSVTLPKKYITKIVVSCHKMVPGENLPHVKSALEKNDHPELDNTELANQDMVTKYMCMIGHFNGMLHWGD